MKAFHDYAAIFVLAPILLALAIIATQSLHWAKTGLWEPVSVSDAFQYEKVNPIYTDWVGVNKLFSYIYESSLSIALIGVSVILFLLVAWVESVILNVQHRRALETNRYNPHDENS